MTLQAVAQEMDGDEALSDLWSISFDIHPVVDGFSSWTMGTSVIEGDNESGGNGVSLSSASSYTFADNDGSEVAIECTFDLSNLITDAGIATRLSSLGGLGTGLTKLVNHYLQGEFVFDNSLGTITVAPDKISGLALDPLLFLDSNQDFSIPVSMLVRDSATINGQIERSEKVETGTLSVDLVGTADTPTVSALNAAGDVGEFIPLTLGGSTTDTDVALGRTQSESMYYIITELPGQSSLSFEYVFVDGNGIVAGYDHEGHWLLYPEDLSDLHIYVPRSGSGTLSFRHSTVAIEDDDDMATHSVEFQVTLSASNSTGENITWPLPPTLQIGASSGLEDNPVTLIADAFPDESDTTNPVVTVVIYDLPEGAKIEGAVLNPFNNKWVAPAQDVRDGKVTITPPSDFSGNMALTMEAVSTTAEGLSATTGPQSTSAYVDPVADGADISCTPSSAVEDETISLAVSLQELDSDGSEQAGEDVYIKIANNAVMLSAYQLVGSGDADATLGGENLVGYYRIPVADMSGILLQPTEQWHGTIQLSLAVPMFESEDDEDGDHMTVSTS